MTGSPVSALLLADGRFPAGGHAHSGGMETAVASGAVTDLVSLARFLEGRLHTCGLTAAGLAAAACQAGCEWEQLDVEAGARTPSEAARASARRQGRQLVRTARQLWPGEALDRLATDIPRGPHHAVALGAVCAAAGLEPQDAARSAALNSISGPASAAVRLLGIDPVQATKLVAELSEAIERIVDEAVAAAAAGPLDRLPSPGAIRLDLFAEIHTRSPVKLFAS